MLDQAGRQHRKELHQLRSADAFADHHRAINIYAVNLKNRLRDIETDRANLAHGRLPSKWFVSTQPPYGTLMPQSGRRPQHQKRQRWLEQIVGLECAPGAGQFEVSDLTG